jgi:hypothetical protein
MMDQASTYRYSRRMPYWAALLGSILLVGALNLTGTTTAQWIIYVLMNFSLALGTVCTVIYFNRYRVILDGDRVSVGTSATKSFILADVTALSTDRRGWATKRLVTLKNGERVTIDGNVENFYELMSVLRERTGIAKSYFNV